MEVNLSKQSIHKNVISDEYLPCVVYPIPSFVFDFAKEEKLKGIWNIIYSTRTFS